MNNQPNRYGVGVDYTSSTESVNRTHDSILSEQLQKDVDAFLKNKKNKIQQIDYAGNVL